MKSKVVVFLLMMCFPFAAFGEDQVSEESIRELMAVTQSERLLENTMSQMDSLMQQSMSQAMGDTKLNPAQEAIAAEMRAKMISLLKEELAWSKMEPRFIQIYTRSFTQSEIDGMLEFYKSDAGKAVIAKMPLVMQGSMEMVQGQMAGIMPKIQELTRETVQKMMAARDEAAQEEAED